MWEDQEHGLQDIIDVIQLIVGEELQHKSGHTAIDPDEEVHASEDHVGCAGDLEHEGGGVHERCDGPPIQQKQKG